MQREAIHANEYRRAMGQSHEGDALIAYSEVRPSRWRLTKREAESVRRGGW